MATTKWLIWSIEQNRWWKSDRMGYTFTRAEAGRYSFKEACLIVKDANEYAGNTPQEAMVKDD